MTPWSPRPDAAARLRPAPLRRLVAVAALLAGTLLGAWPRPLAAQNIVSVPFTNGFIGTRGSSAGTANNVLTFATLQVARLFFIQSSSVTTFELQGNDIPGTLRIVRTNGAIIEMPASANWRNSGGSTVLIGILPRPASPVTLTYAGGSIQITNGENPGGSSIGGYVAGYAGPFAADGDNESGNAAVSQVLNGLNAYLATVVSQRPAGPVTVTAQTTTNTTPTIAGTATLQAGENLTVIVGGTQYSTSTSPAIVRVGSAWSLALATPLATGTHEVAATITNANGFTLSDATTNELVVTTGGGAVTLGGSFTANDKPYDGTTAATGATGGLTLAGVQPGHTVAIGSVTLAFQSAAAGPRTVTITGVTLTGTHAALYTVDLTGAPTASATITPRALTIGGVTATSRTYDGTTTVTLGGTAAYVGLQNGESFAVVGTPAATVATVDVGTGKAVTVTGFQAPSANYTVTQPTGLVVTIGARTATIGGSFTVADRPFDGTTAATLATNALTVQNAAAGDVLTLTGVTAAFATATVGTAKPVSIAAATLAGARASNYTLSLAGAPTTTASITAVGGAVTIGGTLAANDKPYDGTTTATGTTTGLALAGVQPGHVVAIGSVTLAFQSATVGSRTVAITAVTLTGTDAALYTVSLAGAPTTTATITPRPATIGGSFTVADKTADGTTTATLATDALTVIGTVGGESLGLAGVTAAFADAQPGTGKPVALTAATLTGATAANYALSLTGAPTATGTILANVGPSAPIGVGVTAGEGSVTVTWSLPAQQSCGAVSGWIVEWSADGGATWTRGATPGASARSVVLAPLVNNRPYLARVAAVNGCGDGAFASAGPATPLAPIRDGAGQPRVVATGGATVTGGGSTVPVVPQVTGDTLVSLAAGSTTLRLRAVDDSSAGLPVDSTTRAVTLEHGGRAITDGTGFAPATVVTLYLVAPGGTATLLGTTTVGADGRFASAAPIAPSVAPGPYTLQVVGVDASGSDRAAALGVVVTTPPPDLDLAATIDRESVAVGDTVTITLVVTNRGTGPALDAAIPRAFDEPGFTVARAVPLQGTYDAPSRTWRIPRIDPGATARLVLTAIVVAPATPAAPTP